MKINLSKEHIKKGCELVEDNRYFVSSMGDGLQHENHADLIHEANEPLYRDFLQLVIEGINKVVKSSGWSIEQKVNNLLISHNLQEYRVYFNPTITQAKEKAIIYVLDNMEVE